MDQIAERFALDLRAGLSVSINRLVKDYPHLEGLEDLLQSVQAIELLKSRNHQTRSDIGLHSLVIDVDQGNELGNYLIEREIGRGGMGIVFKAFDGHLKRNVAIKVLPPSLLDDQTTRDRFEHEAQTAGRLRHPNIVSIFGVGQAAQHHFFVMDFVDGCNIKSLIWALKAVHQQAEGGAASGSLNERLSSIGSAKSRSDGKQSLPVDERPARDEIKQVEIVSKTLCLPQTSDGLEYEKWVANIGLLLADALDYAHGQGVLHRDIKPANLLISLEGHVCITDFGIAKQQGAADLTRTGDVVGTPRYMAPEAFDGKYGPQSDLYAVGLTLFELLTLRPAIQPNDAKGEIRSALQGDIQSLHRLRPNTSRAFQAVLAKTLDVAPSERYQTAGQLRDDLRRFLNDETVSARRHFLHERFVRWCRREPLTAGLLAVALFSSLAFALVSAGAYWRTSKDLQRVENSERKANAALLERSAAFAAAQAESKRATRNLQVAVRAFKQVVDRIWQRGYLPDAEFVGAGIEATSTELDQQDAQTLETLLVFFDELAKGNKGLVEQESAMAARYVGDINHALGNLSRAERAYELALGRFRQLEKEFPLQSLTEQLDIINEQVIIATVQGEIVRASNLARKSINNVEELVDNHSLRLDKDCKYQLARTHLLYAAVVADSGVESASMKRVLTLPQMAGRGMRTSQMRIRSDRDAIAEAIDLLTELADENPGEIRFRVGLGRALREKARLADRSFRDFECERAIQAAIQTFDNLVRDFPESNLIKMELVTALATNPSTTRAQFVRLLRADEMSAQLCKESPSSKRLLMLRAHVLSALSVHRRRLGDKAADSALLEASDIYQELVVQNASTSIYRVKLAKTYEKLASLAADEDGNHTSSQYLEKAIDTLRPVQNTSVSARLLRNQIQQQLRKVRSNGD